MQWRVVVRVVMWMVVISGACGSGAWAATRPAATTAPLPPWRPIVLFGEVHDNAAQHALRLESFKALLATGARPALLMEQFDRERQGEIDRVLLSATADDADAVIAAGQTAAAASGWEWRHYRPLIALALQYRLPIVAANVSRNDTRRIFSDGLAAQGFEAQVPGDIETAQARAIERSHCGMVDVAMARRMAGAQVARDQFMARMVEVHADRGAWLMAGNGHVRSDVGVPRWLKATTRERVEVVGMLETGDDDVAGYDRVIVTPPQPREDPCAEMKKPAARPAA